MTTVHIYSKTLDGHRAEYIELFARELAQMGVTSAAISDPREAMRSPRVVFAMLDEDIATFIKATFLSIFTRSKIVALFFRPRECFLPGMRYKFKYIVFRAMKLFGRAKIFTILPFSVDDRFDRVAHSWIYDPQLWDLLVFDPPTSAPIEAIDEIKNAARGRVIVSALGAQNPGKGFGSFCQMWASSQSLRETHLFVAAGKVVKECKELGKAFEAQGGILLDRFITENELHGIYRASDLIWSAYSPQYDQASGICGRAYQYGLPVVLRSDSYIETVMTELHHQHLGLPLLDVGADAERMQSFVPVRAKKPTDKMDEMRLGFRAFLENVAS